MNIRQSFLSDFNVLIVIRQPIHSNLKKKYIKCKTSHNLFIIANTDKSGNKIFNKDNSLFCNNDRS